MLVRFEVSSTKPIARIDLELDNGEPPMVAMFHTMVGSQDGRYFRAISFKPVVNGTFTLTMRAYVTNTVLGGSFELVAETTCPNVVVVP